MQRLRVFAAVAAVLVLVLGGLTAYASSSVAVTVKSPLFGLKSASESIKLALANPGVETVKVHLENAQHRLAEAKYLVAANDYNGVSRLILTAYADDGSSDSAIEQSLTSMVVSTDAAISETENIVSPVEATEALSVIDEAQVAQAIELAQMAVETEDKDEAVNEAVLETIAVVEENNQKVAEESSVVVAAVAIGEQEVEVEVVTVTEKEKSDKPTAADLTAKLEAQKASFAVALVDSGISGEDSVKLVERVNKMQAKISEAIAAGNLNKANGLLKAAQALSNNLKHFIKKAETKEAKEELKDAIESEKDALKESREQEREDIKAKKDEFKDELKKLDGSKEEKREKIKEMIKEIREMKKEGREELKNKLEESRDRLEQKREELRTEIKDIVSEEGEVENESEVED